MLDPQVVLPSFLALAVAYAVGFVLTRRTTQWKRLALASFLLAWLVGVVANLPIILAVHRGSDPITFMISVFLIPGAVLGSLVGFSIGVAAASPIPPTERNVNNASAAGFLPVILVAYLSNYVLASSLSPF